MDAVIAVPAEESNGLASSRSAHFGHAPYFVIITVDDGVVQAVSAIPNPPHEHGGCMNMVSLLVSHGVTHVSAGGMGRGPLAGFGAAGVPVYHDTRSQSVGEAVDAILREVVTPFGDDHACGGH